MNELSADFTILALETSCDETAAAVVRGGRVILSNVVASQIDEHRRYGGIVPEVASRQHILTLPTVVKEALADLPGGWNGLVYYRLHGAPRNYWSAYATNHLAMLADAIRRISESADVWCVFDNTASGAEIENALEVRAAVQARGSDARL